MIANRETIAAKTPGLNVPPTLFARRQSDRMIFRNAVISRAKVT
jgi:hypothetical protein